VTQAASMLLTALTALTASSSNAFAGTVAVPEPGTLTLLIAGLGALLIAKYVTTKKVGGDPPVRRPARRSASWIC